MWPEPAQLLLSPALISVEHNTSNAGPGIQLGQPSHPARNVSISRFTKIKSFLVVGGGGTVKITSVSSLIYALNLIDLTWWQMSWSLTHSFHSNFLMVRSKRNRNEGDCNSELLICLITAHSRCVHLCGIHHQPPPSPPSALLDSDIWLGNNTGFLRPTAKAQPPSHKEIIKSLASTNCFPWNMNQTQLG